MSLDGAFGLFDCESIVANRAFVPLRIRDADHSRAAGRALASVLTHSDDWTIERRHNSEQDERNTEKYAPPSQAEHHSRNDKDWGGDEPNVHSTECAFRRHWPSLLLHVDLKLELSSASGTELPLRCQNHTALQTMSVHKPPLLAGNPAIAMSHCPHRSQEHYASPDRHARDPHHVKKTPVIETSMRRLLSCTPLPPC